MRKLIGAFAIAALLAACGQATAPPVAAPPDEYSTSESPAPADPAAAPADSTEPSTEPGYSPPQD